MALSGAPMTSENRLAASSNLSSVLDFSSFDRAGERAAASAIANAITVARPIPAIIPFGLRIPRKLSNRVFIFFLRPILKDPDVEGDGSFFSPFRPHSSLPGRYSALKPRGGRQASV